MEHDTNSLILLAAILVPLLSGVIALLGGRLNTSALRSISALGFGIPLIIGIYLFCHFDASFGRHDSDILAFSADQANFWDSDAVVDARACVSLRRRIMGSASDGDCPLIVHY